MERLRGLDTAFLYLETPTNHLHVAWAAVLDTRRGAGGCIGAGPVRTDRSPPPPAARPAPAARRSSPRLHAARLDRRRRRSGRSLHGAPQSADLEAVAADVLARPLDRRRPLWELHVVEGLPEGRTGMIMKLHHALLDGPSGAELMVQLLDLERGPTAAPRPTARLAVDPQPSRVELDRVARRRASRAAPRAAAEMRNAVDVLAAAQRWDLEHPDVDVPGAFSAPRTPFNRPITARAGRALHRRAARRARQGAPRHRLDGERRRARRSPVARSGATCSAAAPCPTSPLQAMVPVSTRDRRSATGGNQLSALVTTLATDIADPVERLAQVTRVTNAVKRRHDETGARIARRALRRRVAARRPRTGPPRRPPGPAEVGAAVLQRGGLQRARTRCPVLLQWRPGGGGVPDGPDHRLVGYQRDRRELSASPHLRTRRLPRRRRPTSTNCATTSTPRSTPCASPEPPRDDHTDARSRLSPGPVPRPAQVAEMPLPAFAVRVVPVVARHRKARGSPLATAMTRRAATSSGSTTETADGHACWSPLEATIALTPDESLPTWRGCRKAPSQFWLVNHVQARRGCRVGGRFRRR